MTQTWKAAETAVVDGDDPDIGEGTRIWHGAHVRAGARIGRGCNIGQNVYVGADVSIGDGCKLQNNVNVYEGVTLEPYVFCGPSMTFTNLSKPLPRAAITRHDQLQTTMVRRGASIGAGAVVVCGIEIGPFAFVGAGAVVLRSVGAFELVVGNPARRIGWVCVCGNRLDLVDGRSRCTSTYAVDGEPRDCGREYALRDGIMSLEHDPHGSDW